MADADCAVQEHDETNNTASTKYTVATSPDLHISKLTASVSGNTVTMVSTVCNKGGSAATGFVLGLYFNASVAPTCKSSPDLTSSVASLPAGSCTSRTFTRPNAPPGGYVSWVMADATCAVVESDETNNTQPAAYIIKPPKPDAGPDVAVPDTGPDWALPDVGQDGAAPDAAADLASPDTAPDVVIPDQTPDLAIPDIKDHFADMVMPDKGDDASASDASHDAYAGDASVDVGDSPGPDALADSGAGDGNTEGLLGPDAGATDHTTTIYGEGGGKKGDGPATGEEGCQCSAAGGQQNLGTAVPLALLLLMLLVICRRRAYR